jgi:hypothetical protein
MRVKVGPQITIFLPLHHVVSCCLLRLRVHTGCDTAKASTDAILFITPEGNIYAHTSHLSQGCKKHPYKSA